jgi:hypothetical protein
VAVPPSCREQPLGVRVGGGAHVRPLISPTHEQGREDRGHWSGRLAEPDENFLLGGDDVADRQAGDLGERLAVEQGEDRCHSVHEFDGVVGQQFAQQLEPLMLGDRLPLPHRCARQVERGHSPCSHGPGQECLGAAAFVSEMCGVPLVERGLGAGRQCQVPLVRPGDELGGAHDLGSGVLAAAFRQGFPLGSGAKPGRDLPGGELADDAGVLRVGDAGQVPCEPAVE